MKKILKQAVISAVLLSLAGGFSSCVNNPHKQKEMTGSNELNTNLSPTQEVSPNIIVQEIGEDSSKIYLYKPIHLNTQLYHIRPEKTNEEFFLCVPAAYTTKDNKIDGIFIEDGVKLSNIVNTNKDLNGICIVSNDGIEIKRLEEVNDALITQIVNQKKSAFQQTLLVRNNTIVQVTAWQNRIFKRRAIIQFDECFCIGESQYAVTIRDFQETLVKTGAKNAIYLDMGTWSEGWYKNHLGERIVIGENMSNTHRQTNWIVYKK